MAEEKQIRIIIDGAKTGTGGGRGGSKDTLDDLRKQLKTTNNIFERQKILRKLYRATATDTNKLTSETRQWKNELERVNKRVRENNKLGKQNSNTWKSALGSYQFKFNALGNIISNVTSAVTRFVREGLVQVVKVSKDFEEQMSAVQAVTRATDNEFNKLRQDAVRLGGVTIFTAKQVAELQEQLAKLGFTTGEIISATEGILNLAAAAGEDLASSALIAGSTIRAFGEDANEMLKIADAMATSFTSSALNLENFRESMKFVGPVAAKVGFTMEETTAILGKLADQSLRGSIAGTSMRNIMLRLADSGSDLSKAMGFAATSLPELVLGLKNLEESGLDATKALNLVDRRAVTAMLALGQSADGIWNLYRSMVETTGAAEEMAEVRMDNFAGSVEKLTGAWESLILAINKSNGVLRFFVDAATGYLDFITGGLESQSDKASNIASQVLNDIKKQAQEELAVQQRKFNEEAQLVLNSTKPYEEKMVELNRIEKERADFARDNMVNVLERELETYTELVMVNEDIIAGDELNKRQKQSISLYVETMVKSMNLISETIKEINRENEGKVLGQSIRDLEAAADVRKILIQTMEDGAEKEIELTRLKYEKLRSTFISAGEDTKKLLEREQRDIAAIRQKYADEEAKEKQKRIEEEEKERKKRIKERKQALEAFEKIRIEALSDGIEKEMQMERLRYRNQVEALGELKLSAEEYMRATEYAHEAHYRKIIQLQVDFNEKQLESQLSTQKGRLDILNKAAEADKEIRKRLSGSRRELSEEQKKILEEFEADPSRGPNLWERITGGLELTSEQQRAMEKGVDFMVDQLDYLADKQREYADRLVEDSERKITQLQRDLAIQIQLQEQGFANNRDLVERQLDLAEKQQNRALRIREEAIRKQENLEAISQGINLTTAISGILKNTFTKMEPIEALIISAASAAALMALFGQWKDNIKSEVSTYAEGGPILGKKHAEGGELIEAEGGEYIINAEEYSKNRELVEAINEGRLSTAWKGLNPDLSVSLDDQKYEKMMSRYFGTQMMQQKNKRIERTGNKTRVIYA